MPLARPAKAMNTVLLTFKAKKCGLENAECQEVARYFKNLSILLSFEDRFGDLYGRESNRQQKRFPPAFQGNPEKSKDISM